MIENVCHSTIQFKCFSVYLQELYKTATTKLSGPVRFQHSYVNMTNVKVQLNSTSFVSVVHINSAI